MKHLFPLILFLFLLQTMTAVAMPTASKDAPHDMDIKDAGIITGTIFSTDEKGGKKPLVGQKVSIVIYKDGQQVLVLEKQTDQKGKFEFKNIFKDPTFAYDFVTVYNEALFVYPHVHLKPEEKMKEIDFEVGENSPYKTEQDAQGSTESAPPPGMGLEDSTAHNMPITNPKWARPFQTFALALCAVVLLFAGYYYFSPKFRN